MRIALAAAVCLLALPASAAGATERCCFAVRVEASGRIVEDGHTVRWHWTVRHVARFVDKGRIFAGLTRVPGVRPGGVVSFRLHERGPRCARLVRRAGFREGAFASLEDSPAGGELLVVRSGTAVRARCGPAPPLTFELPSPGRTRFRADSFRRVYTVPLADGSARVVLELRHFPRARLAAELRNICG
jgi:hypothetical protein